MICTWAEDGICRVKMASITTTKTGQGIVQTEGVILMY
jgi:hypothetical protein